MRRFLAAAVLGRRSRIAAGSGTQPTDVSALVKQFSEMQRLMKRMGGFGSKKSKKGRKDKGRKGRKGGGRVTSGRTTAKGPAPVPKVDLSEGLPDLRGGGLPGLR